MISIFVPASVLFVTRFRLFVQRRGVSSQFVWGGARRRGILHVEEEGQGDGKSWNRDAKIFETNW